VAAVEMGLKLAAERRRKQKVAPKKKALTHKRPAGQAPPKLLSAKGGEGSPMSDLAAKFPFPAASRVASVTPSAKIASKFASPVTPSSLSQIKKSKKGMLTPKQRIAKTLGLKF
jgi:hypothetical protein